MPSAGDTFDDTGLERPGRALAYSSHLFIVLECDRPHSGGARISLEGIDTVLIGRGETRNVTRRSESRVHALDVRVPGRSMSASHARLVRVGGAWAIHDGGSRNGTFVNGARVERAVLQSGDVVEAGHTLFLVRDAVPTPSDAPAMLDIATPPNGRLLTLDPEIGARLDALARIAPTMMPVLLLGESGTGKEVLARQVHDLSGRGGPFVAVNCGAIPETLLEKELFGHRKGAFSGAIREEVGFVRAADRGTLFLDEIGDLPKSAQAALLRVLQEREVTPLGSTQPTKVDVRVVAATHWPLEEMVARGEFRHDLFARVAGYRMALPPLRERRGDLGILIASLLRRIRSSASAPSFSPAAGRALVRYDWPHNVRELEHCLTMALTLAHGGVVDRLHLPPAISESGEPKPDAQAPTRDDELRLELLAQLTRHHGNLAEVARAMGKARMQVHRWCKRFGVNPDAFRE